MPIHMENICRTCMAKSMTLISIWSSEKSSPNSSNSILEPPSLAQMLNALISTNVSNNFHRRNTISSDNQFLEFRFS